MIEFLNEIRQAMADAFQSGIASVHEETRCALVRLSGEAGQLGLHQAADYLETLSELLEQKKHQTDWKPEKFLDSYWKLNEYIKLCSERAAYDMAYRMMESEEEKE